ncbi:hypothetical protein AB4865_10965 [Capnocytophaga sp. ARDL2]|uniref:hypothetical protein n=1 Tax=Capnocytophaga sp. ARDL2 TaxID=3238809 RepID=UPI0035592C53
MKKVLLTTTSMFLSVVCGYSQTGEVEDRIIPYSVKLVDNGVKINDEITLKKGDKLLVFVPFNNQKDFAYIEKKEGFLSVKNLSKAVDIVGVGAMAVGMGSNNLETMMGAYDVMRKTQSVSYGLEVLDRINELPISKNAKKIAGKYFEITKIEMDGSDFVLLEGLIEKKKYTVYLNQALMLGEIRLKQ